MSAHEVVYSEPGTCGGYVVYCRCRASFFACTAKECRALHREHRLSAERAS